MVLMLGLMGVPNLWPPFLWGISPVSIPLRDGVQSGDATKACVNRID
jgi:hypothetical protein